MLENLLKLVTEHAGEAIVNNPQIPNEQNDAAIQTATDGIFSGLQQQVSSGNLQGLLGMFQGGGDVSSHPITNGVGQNVASNLMQKFGLSSGAAAGIVSALLPMVMNQLTRRTNDPNNSSFDLQSIISSLSGNAGSPGGNAGGLGGLIGGLFGQK